MNAQIAGSLIAWKNCAKIIVHDKVDISIGSNKFRTHISKSTDAFAEIADSCIFLSEDTAQL